MATTRTAPEGWRLSKRTRRVTLLFHVIVSVTWLGLDLGVLTLAITSLRTDDPEMLKAAYLAMDLFVNVLIIPISLLTLLSGLVLSIGTRWGLARYYWVLAKLLLTLGAATASILVLRPEVSHAAHQVLTDPQGIGKADLVVGPTFALVIYVTTTALSIYKPWGRTPLGRAKA